MHGAFFACAAATNLVQWSLRATSTGSILMPGLAAGIAAIVCFHTGSYWLSVRLAVCHCNTIGCWASAPAIDNTLPIAAARMAMERVKTYMASSFNDRANPHARCAVADEMRIPAELPDSARCRVRGLPATRSGRPRSGWERWTCDRAMRVAAPSARGSGNWERQRRDAWPRPCRWGHPGYEAPPARSTYRQAPQSCGFP